MPPKENHKSMSSDKLEVVMGGRHGQLTLQPTSREASETVMTSIWLVHPRNIILAVPFTLEPAEHMQPHG